MEIPAQLKKLYRHWKFHTTDTANSVPDLLPGLSRFINERILIWERKTSGKNPPYTSDAILSTYRFCNIFREFDRQTIAFHTLLNPIRHDFPLWLLNMFACRMIAQTDTVNDVGLLSYDLEANKNYFDRLTHSPRPRFGTPYVFPISTLLRTRYPTREQFIAEYLPTVMRDIAHEIANWHKMPVREGVEKVLALFGFRHVFLWTEVLIDVAYQYPEHIDLFGPFPIGPGSLPTFKKIHPRGDLSVFVAELAAKAFSTDVTYNGKPLQLSAENWEGIGCEFRKYSNLSQGKGRRRKYKRS